MTRRLTLTRPDDWHLHLRDGAMLRAVAPASAGFGRALAMPNLVPPVRTVAAAAAYRERILAALPEGAALTPLMTLYLTEETAPAEIDRAAETEWLAAVKLYPAGATTNSASGVRNFNRVRPALERMAERGLPLCVHGEVVDSEVDVFDREAVFLERVLDPIRRATPGLRVVLEHVTTREGVAYVRGGGESIAGTITVHHLLIDRNHLLAGAIRPHYYCLPVVKRAAHRRALREAACSGDGRFFLGTDSAPHLDPAKESACGCAGCYTAPVALPWLAQVFEEEGALDRLEAFAALNGAAFYGLAPNADRVTLERAPMQTPAGVETGEGRVTVFDPGAPLRWRLAEA